MCVFCENLEFNSGFSRFWEGYVSQNDEGRAGIGVTATTCCRYFRATAIG